MKMKSSNESLRKRGLPNEADIFKAKQLTPELLYKKLSSVLPAERSAAAIALREKIVNNKECTSHLILTLQFEKSLYSKIEICKTLEAGDSTTAFLMCDYLGKIGNNQHSTVPDQVSKKKSYPLPRDIIARSLGKMDKSIFPVLLERAENVSKSQLSELLDAIGFIAFYNQDLAIVSNFIPIIRMYEKYKSNEMIIWKTAICCSSFPIRQSIDLLNNIAESATNETILAEVKRSLKLLNVNTGVNDSVKW